MPVSTSIRECENDTVTSASQSETASRMECWIRTSNQKSRMHSISTECSSVAKFLSGGTALIIATTPRSHERGVVFEWYTISRVLLLQNPLRIQCRQVALACSLRCASECSSIDNTIFAGSVVVFQRSEECLFTDLQANCVDVQRCFAIHQGTILIVGHCTHGLVNNGIVACCPQRRQVFLPVADGTCCVGWSFSAW